MAFYVEGAYRSTQYRQSLNQQQQQQEAQKIPGRKSVASFADIFKKEMEAKN